MPCPTLFQMLGKTAELSQLVFAAGSQAADDQVLQERTKSLDMDAKFVVFG